MMRFTELSRKMRLVGSAADPRLVPALTKRLELFRRYEQDIARAADPASQRFWLEVRRQEKKNLERLEELLERRLVRQTEAATTIH